MTDFAWNIAPALTPIDLYLAFGDSMTAGRGDIANAPVGYPPGAALQMVKLAATGYETLAEPCGEAAGASTGVGPWGMTGWLAGQVTGRLTAVVNGGWGGTRSDQWVPGQTYYNAALSRLQRALSRRNVTLRAILVYMGPNDAAFSATPAWRSNVQATLAAFRAVAGRSAAQCPAIVSRLTTYVPTDLSYPGWAYVQAQIAALADANHILLTPPSPAAREAYNLHHNTAQNYTIAQSALAALQGHASWVP